VAGTHDDGDIRFLGPEEVDADEILQAPREPFDEEPPPLCK
jgi:hypothetical protein